MRKKLPILIIALGIAMIYIGAQLEQTPTETDNNQGSLFVSLNQIKSDISTQLSASPTRQVVVVANGNQQPPSLPAIPNIPSLPVAQVANAAQQIQPYLPKQVNNIVATAVVISPTTTPTVLPGSWVPTPASVITVTATLQSQPTQDPIMRATIEAANAIAATQIANLNWQQCAAETCDAMPEPTSTPKPQPTQPLPPLPLAIAAQYPTLTPTALPPTPTITPTSLPESNEIQSYATLQGSTDHTGISITIVELATNNALGSIETNKDGFFHAMGLDQGEYQLIAHSPNGSHLPACTTVQVGGNESVAIPQTMLSNGGGFNTDETMNIGAAALVAIQLQLTIPDELKLILDVSHDGIVNEDDANMLIANPKLLACQAW